MLNSIVSGGISGAIIVWLFRNWISERIQASIKHEYAQKLEAYKAELNSNMQAALYERQLYQLRTSLFFDHQRAAFASILSQIAETKRKWSEIGFEPETGCWMHEPVPSGEYDKLKKVYSEHQLFLDQDCIFAFKLVLDAMGDSLPFQDGDGTLRHRETQEPYRRLDFLQDRIAILFQEKIGIRASPEAREELALLGAVRLVNRYHFADIGMPVKGALKLEYGDDASDAIVKARNNKEGLILKLKELKAYLEKEGSFNEALQRARYCINMLDKKMVETT